MAEFTTQVNLAMIALAKQAYFESIEALALAYIPQNLWDQENNLMMSPQGLMDSLDIVTNLVALPEIDAQDFVNTIMQQMQNALEQQEPRDGDMLSDAIHNFRHLIDALHQGLQLFQDQGVAIGKSDDPFIKLGLFIENNRINFNLYGRISNQPKGLNHEEAQQLQDAFLKVLKEGTDYQQLINMASKLSNQGNYLDSNTVLEKIALEHPERKAASLNLMGANWFFIGNYEKAIDYYLQAHEAGESKDMIDFNVWEACRELYKSADSPEEALRWKNYYKQLFPQGKHHF